VVAEPKTFKLYNDGAHELNAEARCDRAEWLADKIGLKINNQKRKSRPKDSR
jgi:hypothetical protein